MTNLRTKEADRVAQMFQNKKDPKQVDEDKFFGAKEFHTSNREVANILASSGPSPDDFIPKAAQSAANIGEAN
jgi:hypothetical protein